MEALREYQPFVRLMQRIVAETGMSRVLQGIRVLETSNFVSGPYACQMLAEYGADVVKVENPKGGDPFRSFAPNLYGPTFARITGTNAA